MEINLETMTADELMGLWSKINRHPVKTAREIFTTRRTGYVSVTESIGAYACNKAVAMRCEAIGNVTVGKSYEDICDTIYYGLPGWVKWAR